MKLFDDTKRADTSPALFSESSYQFVNRVAGAPWDKVRALLEAWFVEHPANATRDLYNRFTDIDDSQHLGAWWELYIASLFRLLGYDVAAHPTVEGSKRQPDFLMSRGNTSFYVECTVASPGDGAGTRGTPEWIYDCGDRAAVAVLRHRPRLLHVQFLRTMSTPNGLCPLRFLHPEGLQQSATVGGQGKLQRMLASVPLTDDEQAAVDDGQAALDRLLERLIDVATPDGETPREIGVPATATLLPIIAVNE